MCGQIAPQSPVEIFVQKKTHLGRGENVLTRFFQESDDLLALYAREPVEKLLDRIARFQVIEKTLHRDASSGKNRLSAKNSGFFYNNLFHDNPHRLPKFNSRLHATSRGIRRQVRIFWWRR